MYYLYLKSTERIVLLISLKHWSKASSVDDVSVITHKTKPFLLVQFSPWIFCSFLKFLRNVKSPLRILWNFLHKTCFKLHTSFNRVETGSTRKISLSFRFVEASRKKSFHFSACLKSHKAEVRLCNFYQFAGAFNCIASCKIFCPSFCSIIVH